MYRHSPFPYYNYDRGYHTRPFRYWQGYYPIPFNNYINSNFAQSNQNLYNSGIMDDVYQGSIISQAEPEIGIGCTQPQM